MYGLKLRTVLLIGRLPLLPVTLPPPNDRVRGIMRPRLLPLRAELRALVPENSLPRTSDLPVRGLHLTLPNLHL